MKKYRIDFERRVNFGEPITETMLFAYDDDGMTMADALREFYERCDPYEIMSLTVAPVSAFEPRYEDEVIGQMSFFDYSKQSNRYAEGGLVAPEKTGLASGLTGVPAADYVGLVNDANISGNIGSWSIEPHCDLEPLQQAICKALRADAIRGNN